MKKRNRILALLLSATMLLGMAPVSTAWGAAEEPEIVAGGYEIDMDDLPKVYFSEHPRRRQQHARDELLLRAG